MDRSRGLTRRDVARGIAAVGGGGRVAVSVRLRNAAARVVVIGGGFGGASCARALRQARSANCR